MIISVQFFSLLSGILNGGELTTVTITINSNANILEVGSYTDTIIFTNITNGEGNTTRSVNLTVYKPGSLDVNLQSALLSSGKAGGSFSPSSQIYILQNTGSRPLEWTVIKSAEWITLEIMSGRKFPGEWTTVTVSINGNANSLPVGNYSDTVTFTNTKNGQGNPTRIVSLTIHVPVALTSVGQRLETRARIIRFEYAKLSIGIIKNFHVEVSKYVLLRKAGNQSHSAVKEFTESDVVNNATTYNDPGLNRAETYSYVVEARRSDGSVIARSNEVALGTRSALSVEGDTKALIKEKVNKLNGLES
ncbi:MAG: hypothetical protein WBI18_04815 [Candidatus Saccharicenans sp.]